MEFYLNYIQISLYFFASFFFAVEIVEKSLHIINVENYVKYSFFVSVKIFLFLKVDFFQEIPLATPLNCAVTVVTWHPQIKFFRVPAQAYTKPQVRVASSFKSSSRRAFAALYILLRPSPSNPCD